MFIHNTKNREVYSEKEVCGPALYPIYPFILLFLCAFSEIFHDYVSG